MSFENWRTCFYDCTIFRTESGSDGLWVELFVKLDDICRWSACGTGKSLTRNEMTEKSTSRMFANSLLRCWLSAQVASYFWFGNKSDIVVSQHPDKPGHERRSRRASLQRKHFFGVCLLGEASVCLLGKGATSSPFSHLRKQHWIWD